MEHLKGSFLTGYIIFLCKGSHIEQFLIRCTNKNIRLTDINRINEKECVAKVSYKSFKAIQEISESLGIEIELLEEKGIPYSIRKTFKRRELLLSLLLSFLLILFLSNIIWSIEIRGLPKEIEYRVEEQLKEYGIKKGSFIFTTPPPSVLQQQLISDIPELLWIGIEVKGTSFIFEGVEKLEKDKGDHLKPRHLVASKDAVIRKMYVEKGRPTVKVNDFVKKDDLLISGILTKEEGEMDDEIEEEVVAAEGEVTGEVWYEVEVSIPLQGQKERLTGKSFQKNSLLFDSKELPISGFTTKDFTNSVAIEETHDIHFLFWRTPFKLKKTIVYEAYSEEYTLNEKEAKEEGIKSAIYSLKRQIGQEIRIVAKNLLQETRENGKVNLTLFIIVEEDITKSRPINQGD